MRVNPAITWTVIVLIVLLWLFWPRKENKTPVIDRSQLLAQAQKVKESGSSIVTVPKPKRGDAIFENADSPRTWKGYIGQPKAKKMLQLAIKSAAFRGERLEHILIASAAPGIGKSALARLIGAELGVGVIEIQDTLDLDRARAIIGGMKDRDILVWDEFHQALNKGKKVAEWLLPFLQDGTLPSDEGLVKMPAVTLVAATTDYEGIPETIMSRFRYKPVLENYTEDEYKQIAKLSSGSFFDKIGLEPLTDVTLGEIAAASPSPRLMKNLMAALRDCEIGGETERDSAGNLNMKPVLSMMGLTRDGLTQEQTDYLLKLYIMGGGPVGVKNIVSALGLQEIPWSTEGVLKQRGYVQTSIEGRALTAEGKERVLALVDELADA